MNKLIVFGDTNISTTRDLYPALHISDAIKERHTECDVLSNDPLLNESDRDLLKRARILQFGSSSLKSEPSRSKLYQSIDVAAKNGAIVSYAPRIDTEHWQMRSEELRILRSPVATADVVQVLPQDLPFLAGEADAWSAISDLNDQGVRLVLGMLENGVFLLSGEDLRKFPAIKASDADAFLAELLCRLSALQKPLKACPFAEIAALVDDACARFRD